MDIFVKSNEEKFNRISELEGKDFPQEDKVQADMKKNIEILTMNGNSEFKLLALGREIKTGSGPLDILAIDDSGEIYIIEAKLNKNHTRREIIAQVFDYAAGLWEKYRDFKKFEEEVIRTKENGNKSLKDLIKTHEDFKLLDDEQIQEIIENVQKNLEKGMFKFITVWDKRDEKLDNIINYINEKIENITIYVITLKYFRDNGLELYIPDVFGREAEKQSATKSGRGRWNEDSLRKKFQENFSEKELLSFEKLFKFSQENGHIKYGTGMVSASMNPVFAKFSKTGTGSLFTLTSTGKLSLNFDWIKEELRKPFAEEFEKELGFPIGQSGYPELTRDQWSKNTEKIIKVIQKFL